MQSWVLERGSLICEEAGARIVRFRFTGHVDASFAGHVQRTVETLLAGGARPHLFFDAEAATGLDTQFRVQLTPWHKRIAAQVQSQNVLLKSKIMAMAISVANMTSGHVIKPYNKRQEFEAAIAAAKH